MSGGVPAGLDAIRHYIAMRDAKPFRQMDDVIHSVHIGTKWEAELRLSDLRLAATPTPPIEGRDADVERVVDRMARAMYCADNDMSLEGNEAHLAYWFDNPDENDKGGVEEYRVMARAALQALGERG